MKIAILDKDEYQVLILSKYLSDDINPDIDLFIYHYQTQDELIKSLLELVNFQMFFIDNSSCQPICLSMIREFAPHSPIVLMTDNINVLNLNNEHILFKPFQLDKTKEVFNYWLSNYAIKHDLLHYIYKNTFHTISIHDIYYIESYYGKVYLYTKEEKLTGIYNEIYKYENLLTSYDFLSIHKSILVNMNKIKDVHNDEYILDNDVLLIASARKKHLAYKKYLYFSNKKT